MPGTFIISLDFELMWGVRDKRSIADYGDAVLGARRAVPQMLERFAAAGVRATWATVGMLFARGKRELLAIAPDILPAYYDPRLSPYPELESEIGDDEDHDPYHFAPSLIDQIAETEGQELATHTFSHFYCLERGAELAAFEADLVAARTIAGERGIQMRSIVFPRNQMSEAYIAAAARDGFTVYRGNPGGLLYRSRNGKETSQTIRGLRLLDSVAPIARRVDVELAPATSRPINAPASRFLRPWARHAPQLALLQRQRIIREMTRAACDGRAYHLWWHPHNFGRGLDQNLAQLDAILTHFRALSDLYGMESLTMGALADRNVSAPVKA